MKKPKIPRPDFPIGGQTNRATNRALDAGSWFDVKFKEERIPTLEELLSLVKNSQKGEVPLAVNVKAVDLEGEKRMVQLIQKYGLLKQSFFFDQSEDSSLRLKQLNPQVHIGKNVGKNQLEKELKLGVVDVFLIGFVPTKTQSQHLRQAGKSIIVNKGDKRENENRPEAWVDYLKADIDGILVDYVEEIHQYPQTLKR